MEIQEYRAAFLEGIPDGHVGDVRKDVLSQCQVITLMRRQDHARASQAITDALIEQAAVPVGWLVQHVMDVLIRVLEVIPPPPYLWND